MLDAIPFQLIAAFAYVLLLIVGIKRKLPVFQHVLYTICYIYVVELISITLFPMPVQKDLIMNILQYNEFSRGNYIPFRSIVEWTGEAIKGNMYMFNYQFLGNILLFMPLGFLLPLASKKFSNFRSVLFASICVSAVKEFFPVFLSLFIGYPYKVTDIDAFLLNIAGTLIGFAIIYMIKPYIKRYADIAGI